jgi:hypothetical protein
MPKAKAVLQVAKGNSRHEQEPGESFPASRRYPHSGPIGGPYVARRRKPMKCKRCKIPLKHTARSRKGRGPLAELRCPKCRVLFYINREKVLIPSQG